VELNHLYRQILWFTV